MGGVLSQSTYCVPGTLLTPLNAVLPAGDLLGGVGILTATLQARTFSRGEQVS